MEEELRAILDKYTDVTTEEKQLVLLQLDKELAEQRAKPFQAAIEALEHMAGNPMYSASADDFRDAARTLRNHWARG